MTENDIANALGQVLYTAALGYPIAWEGQEIMPARPYLMFEVVPTSRRNYPVAGLGPISDGFVQVNVKVRTSDKPTAATQARQIAQSIMDLFPANTSLAITDGNIVLGDSGVKQGYADGVGWSLPVQIKYKALAA